MRHRVPFRLPLGVAALLLLLLLVTVGCQASPSPESVPTVALPATLPQPSPTPAPASTPIETAVPAVDEEGTPAATLPALAPGAEPLVAVVRADLAGRLGVSEDEIAVKAVAAVEWSDGSLGCPRPGISYIQVLTPGFRVVLEVESVEYEYHTDTRQTVVLCDEASMPGLPAVPGPTELPLDPVVSGPGVVEPGFGGLVNEAREDLAGRLSIPVDQIELLAASSVVWPDGSLCCPQPGMDYLQIPQEGMLIRLNVGGNVYNYHNGEGRDLFLCQPELKDIEPLPIFGND